MAPVFCCRQGGPDGDGVFSLPATFRGATCWTGISPSGMAKPGMRVDTCKGLAVFETGAWWMLLSGCGWCLRDASLSFRGRSSLEGRITTCFVTFSPGFWSTRGCTASFTWPLPPPCVRARLSPSATRYTTFTGLRGAAACVGLACAGFARQAVTVDTTDCIFLCRCCLVASGWVGGTAWWG